MRSGLLQIAPKMSRGVLSLIVARGSHHRGCQHILKGGVVPQSEPRITKPWCCGLHEQLLGYLPNSVSRSSHEIRGKVSV